MSTRLKYDGKEALEFTLTRNPVTLPQQSPAPMGKFLKDLDPNHPKYRQQKAEIENHANYSPSEKIILKPGINLIENDEHAEYIYQQLGVPEIGGTVPFGVHEQRTIVNRNICCEVDAKGEEIKDNLFLKYRIQRGVQTAAVR